MQRHIACVLGKTGSGKSRLIIWKIVPALSAPVFILDTMDDFPYGLHFSSTMSMCEYIVAGRQNDSGIYVVKADSDEDAEQFFYASFNMGVEHTIVVDEVDKFAGTHNIDDYLNRIIRYGRRRGVSCVFAARRPVELHPTIRAQSDVILSLRQDAPEDIATMKKRGGAATDLPGLSLYRNTGQESEYLSFGDFTILPYSSILNPRNKQDFINNETFQEQ